MTTKVEIYNSKWKKESGELPDKCPKCGADFHEPYSIKEYGYMAVSQTCCIDKEGNIDYEESTYENYFESQYTTEFLCSQCDHTLMEASEEIE